jgi:hypothetical protein
MNGINQTESPLPQGGTPDGSSKPERFRGAAALFPIAVMILAGLSASCNSPQPAEATSATSVIITNRSSEEIKAAATQTFKVHEYEPVAGEDPGLAFQKRGTFMNDLMSPDWFDGPSWVVVKLFLHPLDAERIRLDCRVFLVQQPDDPLFMQKRAYGGHRKDFENLVHEIGRNLNRPPDAQQP